MSGLGILKRRDRYDDRTDDVCGRNCRRRRFLCDADSAVGHGREKAAEAVGQNCGKLCGRLKADMPLPAAGLRIMLQPGMLISYIKNKIVLRSLSYSAKMYTKHIFFESLMAIPLYMYLCGPFLTGSSPV